MGDYIRPRLLYIQARVKIISIQGYYIAWLRWEIISVQGYNISRLGWRLYQFPVVIYYQG